MFPQVLVFISNLALNPCNQLKIDTRLVAIRRDGQQGGNGYSEGFGDIGLSIQIIHKMHPDAGAR